MALPTGFEPVTFASTVRCSDLTKLRELGKWWVPEDSNLLTPAPRFQSRRIYNPLRGKEPKDWDLQYRQRSVGNLETHQTWRDTVAVIATNRAQRP